MSVQGADCHRLNRLEGAMKQAWLALMICGAAAAIGTTPAAALDYPYCIKGCDFGAGRGDCSFSSYQQCQATASGRDAYCAENPFYNAKAEMQADRIRPYRRRF
jgi:hypothetical protein